MAERRDVLREREAIEPGPAKVNLALRVLGRRDDGYHDVDTLIVPLDLADTVTVRAVAASGPARPRSLTVAAPAEVLDALPDPEENLAWRAADAFERAVAAAGTAPFRVTAIHIDKRVPVAAGLGGGSSDAAAVLRAANRLSGATLSGDDLERVALEVGSDVPALLPRRPVRARGRGEDVDPAAVPPLHLVLVPVPLAVRAGDAYAWWDDDGAATGPPLSAILRAAEGGDVGEMAREAFDDLQQPVADRHPAVTAALADLRAAGAIDAIMSGSGPTVFGIARDRAHAAEVAARVARPAEGDASPRPSIVATSVGSV